MNSGVETESAEHGQDQKSPFVVLGVALVVDQLGKGARMVLRYPTSSQVECTEDLFFRLPSRQMAKLFRPKPALCGQPMTLSVGGTVFCCCATLMGGGDEKIEVDDEETATETMDHLVLFSVIVALAPQAQTCLIPISGWMEGGAAPPEDHTATHVSRSLQMVDGKLGAPKGEGSKPSASFLSTRRVHVSLARLCRVLEREERRCRYVSLQAELFKKIRSDVQKSWKDQQFKALSTPKGSAAVHNPGSVPVGSERIRSHRRASSFGRGDIPVERTANMSNQADDDIVPEIEQEVLEIIMAVTPNLEEAVNAGLYRAHQGNLARELAQVFHALGRNDHDFPTSPSDLLTGRSGIVYINRHIAVAIEALTPNRGVSDFSKPVVFPYQTLLFPQASPSQLLDSLKMSGSAAPRRLQQFLLMISPQKSVKDIAADANLPLQRAIEIATYLVGQGACLVSPVLSRSSRLVCRGIDRIREATLAFSQTYGPSVNLFLLVSFLTHAGLSLGDSMMALTTSTDKATTLLREEIEASLLLQVPITSRGMESQTFPLSPTNPYGDRAVNPAQEELRHVEELEDLLYQMATWLRSRQVLNHKMDFLVATSPLSTAVDNYSEEATNGYEGKSEKKVDGTIRNDGASDDALFRELMDLDCLDGQSSIQNCCWRLGIEPSKLKAFALRHNDIRIISREPTEGDEW